jgi:hypothetical protein
MLAPGCILSWVLAAEDYSLGSDESCNKLGNNRAECCLKLPNSKPGNRMELKIVKRFEFSAD